MAMTARNIQTLIDRKENHNAGLSIVSKKLWSESCLNRRVAVPVLPSLRDVDLRLLLDDSHMLLVKLEHLHPVSNPKPPCFHRPCDKTTYLLRTLLVNHLCGVFCLLPVLPVQENHQLALHLLARIDRLDLILPGAGRWTPFLGSGRT